MSTQSTTGSFHFLFMPLSLSLEARSSSPPTHAPLRESPTTAIALCALQLASRASLFAVVLAMIARTRLYRSSRPGFLWAHFRPLLLAAPPALALLLALRGLKLDAAAGTRTLSSLWHSGGFLALFITNALASAALYFACFHASFRVARPDMHRPDPWRA